MTQVNITEISNGFLVATQPSINKITSKPQEGQVTYFATLPEAQKYISTLFPADLG